MCAAQARTGMPIRTAPGVHHRRGSRHGSTARTWPSPRTVTMNRGADGSGSTFDRSRLMYVQRLVSPT
jgi:hypothetical protein